MSRNVSWLRLWRVWAAAALSCGVAFWPAALLASPFQVLAPNDFEHHIARFNRTQPENRPHYVPDAKAWDWLRANVPFFECPDSEVEEIYYFRWWSFRKHLVETTNGFVITEFLPPIGHAGIHNTISCATGHHLAEGRWLRDQRYLNDYIRFWLQGAEGKPQPHFHKYSSWFAAAVYDRYQVNLDRSFAISVLDGLVADFNLWEKERRLSQGLFWQYDVRDGMEESISGSRTEKNLRPTLNSYMFGNARAIAALAQLATREQLAHEFSAKANELKNLVQQTLWNSDHKFFEVRLAEGGFAGVREQIGFIPWMFGLPDGGFEQAWKQLSDAGGFRAPYGLTTAERRHPQFRSHGCCGCEWDGAVWPFATSQTLVGLGKVLRDYSQPWVTSQDYFAAFLDYVRCHRFDGEPYIGEYLDETTGQWLKGKQERSRYYNHSTFADLVITGIVGLRPRAESVLEIHPLLPEQTWDYFCLDGVSYHGRTLTIVWDRDGQRYNRGAGLSVIADGKVLVRGPKLEKLTGRLE